LKPVRLPEPSIFRNRLTITVATNIYLLYLLIYLLCQLAALFGVMCIAW